MRAIADLVAAVCLVAQLIQNLQKQGEALTLAARFGLVFDDVLQFLHVLYSFSDLRKDDEPDYLLLQLDEIEFKFDLVEGLYLEEVCHVLKAERRSKVPKLLRHLFEVRARVEVFFRDGLAYPIKIHDMVPLSPLRYLKSYVDQLIELSLYFKDLLIDLKLDGRVRLPVLSQLRKVEIDALFEQVF